MMMSEEKKMMRTLWSLLILMMIQNVCARALKKKNLPFFFSFADKIDTDVYEKLTHQLFRQQKKRTKKFFLTT